MFDIFYYKNKNRTFLENLEKTVDRPQNYVPIYKVFFDLTDTNYNQISLNQKYHIVKGAISSSGEAADAAGAEDVLYGASTMDAVLESSGAGAAGAAEKTKRQIFIKYSPVLDPIKYMIGKYDLSDARLRALPQINSTDSDCLPKILDTNNSSYIDGFFTYLTSQLLNHHGFIHGVDYYGSYMGIQRKYKMNVVEDIEYLQSSNFFRKNLGSLFEVDNPYEDGQKSIYENSRNCKTRLEISNLADAADEDIVFDDITELSVIDRGEHTDATPAPETIPVFEPTVEYEKGDTQSLDSLSESDDDSSLNYTSDGEENAATEDENASAGGATEEAPAEDAESNSDDASNSAYSESSTEVSSGDDIIATIYNFPVHMIALEKCEGTLDELMICNYAISDEEWRSALFQVIMTLAVLQKSFYLTHNDLHTNNIMFVPTKHKYIYYKIENTYFKVPTYGKIYKIIDFGRAIYTYRGKLFCSDSFDFHGDAATQYNFPPYYDDKKPTIEPNYSFDLCRLGCSIYDCLIDDDDEYAEMSALKKMIYDWCCDDNGKNVLYKKNGEERYPDFKLYKMIARTVHKHTPLAQLSRPFFRKYLCVVGCLTNEKQIAETAAAAKLFVDIDAIPCYANAP